MKINLFLTSKIGTVTYISELGLFLVEFSNEIRLFDPDPDIADAWFRLQKGNYNEQDMKLLQHEYFEARFEGIFKTDYRTAHNATIKSGRTWTF